MLVDNETRLNNLMSFLYELRCLYENTSNEKYLEKIDRVIMEIELLIVE